MVENCCCLCLISDDIETWQIMFYPLAYRFGFCNTELVLGFCTEMSESLHNNNNNRTMFVELTVHPVHAKNAEQRQMAVNLWTKPTDFSHWPTCRQLWNCIYRRHSLLFGPKADRHFTIPQGVEDWVDLDSWLRVAPTGHNRVYIRRCPQNCGEIFNDQFLVDDLLSVPVK